ncbi:MAG: GFA family protein, partial [Pseudomonadota bacterium]|nr:GFA family protein [Pseudomonadota bacterium]
MKGSCLCGAVTITAPDLSEIAACHCGMCRRWGGGPFMTLHAGQDVKVEGDVKTYRSSDWAERAFCGTCGTHLYYHLLPV